MTCSRLAAAESRHGGDAPGAHASRNALCASSGREGNPGTSVTTITFDALAGETVWARASARVSSGSPSRRVVSPRYQSHVPVADANTAIALAKNNNERSGTSDGAMVRSPSSR